MGDKITIIRGDDATIILSLIDEDGIAVDLTNAIVNFSVKRRLEDTEALLNISVTNHDDPLEGSTSIILSNEDTEIEPGSYVWDIQIEKDSFKTSTNYGIFKVVYDVTPNLAS